MTDLGTIYRTKVQIQTPFPSILLANVQAIENRTDELRSRCNYQRELRDCCVLCFMETWLNPAIPDCALQAEGFSKHCMDQMVSLDPEYLTVKCRPYHLPLEFTSTILSAIYIPSHADVKNALDKIDTATNTLETKFPEALFIAASNFNQANPKQRWSETAEDHLRVCLESVDWTMLKCSAENLEEYATTVTYFIHKCGEDCTPKKSIRFEQNASSVVMPAPTAPDTPVRSVTSSDVRLVCRGVNPRKVTGLDSVPSQTLRSFMDQLAEVFTNIFNLSLLQANIPTCFKKTTIIPVPKISLHSSLEHLDNKDTYVKTPAHRLQLRLQHHYPLQTDLKLCDLGLGSTLCNWILSFLTHSEDRQKGGERIPIYINGTEAERVKSIKFLRVTITNNLSWTSHIDVTVKKAQQCLFFLRRLRKFVMSIRSLTNSYRCATENILSGCITAWYGNRSAQDRKKLQKVVCIAQTITE
eukprot:g29868.t1